MRDHIIVDRFVSEETAQRVQVFAETLCLVDVGKLVFQREVLKYCLQPLIRIFFLLPFILIASVQRDGKVIKVQEITVGQEGVFAGAVDDLQVL